MEKRKTTAIVLAAGSGRRMKSREPKQFLQLEGYPLLYYSMRCFQDSPLIDDIILVTGKDMIDYCRKQIVEKYGFTKTALILPGGRERYDSVYEGLKGCRDTEIVLIHDSARPFVTENMLSFLLQAVSENPACVAGVPSKDTVNLADENGIVTTTPDRRGVWIVQTPQVFDYSLLFRSHELLRERPDGLTGITDDAMVVSRAMGLPVRMVMGSYRNIKVTTPDDLVLARAFLGDVSE